MKHIKKVQPKLKNEGSQTGAKKPGPIGLSCAPTGDGD